MNGVNVLIFRSYVTAVTIAGIPSLNCVDVKYLSPLNGNVVMINRKSVSIRVWFRVLTAMLCLSVVGEALEAQSSSEDSSVYYEKALIRFADGDYDGAAIQLKNALQIDPDDLVARLLLGRTYLRLSDGASAEVQIRHARQGGADEELVLVPLAKSYFIQGKYQQIVDEIASTDDTLEVKAEIHVLRGRAFIELGELDRAEGEFAYATMLRPEYADALMGQGRVLLRRGHFEQGEALVERANAMEPDNGDTWHFKAEISRQRGDLNLALTYFDRAIELQEFHMPARVGRAALLIGLDRDEEALEDIMFVRERLPTDAQAAYLYGFVLTRRGDTQEAQAVLSEAVNALKQLPPDFLNEHSPSLYLFGLIAYAQGQYDDAYRHLVRFLEFAPSHVKARKLVGSLEIKFGESLTAIDTLESAVVLAPNDPQAHELLGEAYRQRGRYEEAARMFEKASELARDDVDVKAKVIVSHLTMGRRQEAISELESALQQEPDNVQALLLLARLQLNAKQYDAALRTVLRTSKLAPDTAQSYNIAGAAQFGKGDFRSARAAFEHAIEIRPDFVPAKLNLANLTRKQGRVQEAKESYLKILKDHDNNVRALESLAELAELEDRITDAISWREEIRAAHPKSVREVLPLIGIYLKREQPKAAWVVSQDLVTRQPTNPTVLLAATQVEVALDKPDRARTTLQSATRYAGYNSRELYVIAKQ